MLTVSELLGKFQVRLSEGLPAEVHPKIATDVMASISYIDDTTPTAMSRKAHTHKKTMCDYCNPTKKTCPNFNKMVHLLDKLGYEVYIKKRGDV